MELRKLDFEKIKYFECGGRKFYLQDTISFMRWMELNRIGLEFGYSATFVDIFKNVNTAMEHMNKLKFTDAVITLHNILIGIKSLEEKSDPAFRICALFINEEGEDIAGYDESKMKEKIDCWGKELDPLPFFRLASSLVPSWTNAYKIVIRDGLEQGEVKE